MEAAGRDIKGYLELIYRKKHIFIITALVVMTIAMVTSYVLPKEYEAKSTVFIERSLINNLIKGVAITSSMEDRLRVLSYTMSSRSLLLKVISDLDLDSKRDDQTVVEKLLADFRKHTEIRIRNENDLFVVSYTSGDPKFARDYVNTLVRRYIEENLSEKREETYGANRFLAEQIKFFKEKLDKADEDIIKFRKEKGIFVSLDDRKIVEELKSGEEDLEEIKIEKKELEARKLQVLRHIKDEKPYTATMMGKGTGDPNERILLLQRHLTDLLLTYTPNYPEVARIRAEIESLRAQAANKQQAVTEGTQGDDAELSILNPFFQQLREELSKTELQLASLTAKEQQIRRLMESKKMYLKNIPADRKGLSDLEMQRATTKNIYEELIARLGQSEVAKQMEIQDKAATFRIVDPAVLPVKPVSPNRVKIIFLGILGGLFGGAGIIILLDYMDRSVNSVDGLKGFGLPVLAVIPKIRHREEMMQRSEQDMRLYKFAGFYMLCILSVFILELLGLPYMDDFISAFTRFPERLMGLTGLVKGIF